MGSRPAASAATLSADFDPIIVLHHGRIAERGSHSTLMATKGGLYQRLAKLQQLQEDEDADDLPPWASNG